jgi:hypothetical protein
VPWKAVVGPLPRGWLGLNPQVWQVPAQLPWSDPLQNRGCLYRKLDRYKEAINDYTTTVQVHLVVRFPVCSVHWCLQLPWLASIA